MISAPHVLLRPETAASTVPIVHETQGIQIQLTHSISPPPDGKHQADEYTASRTSTEEQAQSVFPGMEVSNPSLII
jgi:hypothetical protein